MSKLVERLVRLEIESARRNDVEAIRLDLAKVLAWQDHVDRRVRQCGRLALWCALLAGSHYASGPWGQLLGSAAKRFAGGLG